VTVEIGRVIAGKYRIDRVIGSGGMGVVVAARHLHLQETVAIKVLKPEAVTKREAVLRLLREARATMRVRSEHVVRVLDVDMLDGSVPYIVMEHLEGCDVASFLADETRLPIARAVSFVLQACEAVAEAHALGVIHRDIKPANLFLTRRPDGSDRIKLLDFGVSKIAPFAAALAEVGESTAPDDIDETAPPLVKESKAVELTLTDAKLGSPRYMSPEQIRSARDVDERADIWGLGATLYELVAGSPPFAATTVPELSRAILHDAQTPLREVRPEVSPRLEAIVQRCLAKRREDRYASVSALALDLQASTAERSPRGWIVGIGLAAAACAVAVAMTSASKPSAPREAPPRIVEPPAPVASAITPPPPVSVDAPPPETAAPTASTAPARKPAASAGRDAGAPRPFDPDHAFDEPW
jgi:serine/threonine-protein kinase